MCVTLWCDRFVSCLEVIYFALILQTLHDVHVLHVFMVLEKAKKDAQEEDVDEVLVCVGCCLKAFL